jgi:hypothetical protein
MSPYNPDKGEPFDAERIRVGKLSTARAMAKDCASRTRPTDGKAGTILVSMTGAYKRWARFTDCGEYVSVTLIDTEILRFYARYVQICTSNWLVDFNTVLTRKVINNLLSGGAKFAAAKVSGPLTMRNGTLFYSAHPGDEAVEVPDKELRVSYAGKIVTDSPVAKKNKSAKEVETPLAA